MSVLKLLSVEYDSKTNELKGGMIDRLYEILSEEEKKKVIDVLEIVSEAFIEDIEVEPISKVKSYQPIKEEREAFTFLKESVDEMFK